jgi:rod shape determining protein RodA
MSAPNKSFIARLDGVTLLLYFLLVMVGLIAVFSVEYRSTDASIFIGSKSHMKQAMFFGISFFIGVIILFTDSKAFSSVAFLSYTLGLVLLVVTIFAGASVKGSHSWLGVGAFRFQPGEVCKLFTALALARYLSLPEINFKSLKHRLVGLAITFIPSAIIILQNETGLALVYFSFILVMYREGLPGGILVAGFLLAILAVATLLIPKFTLLMIIGGLAVATIVLMRKKLVRDGLARIIFAVSLVFSIVFSQFIIPFAFGKVLQGYQIERIYSMLGTEVPPEYVKENNQPVEEAKKKDNNYNVNQSKIAIGSGGLMGKGFLNGTSTKNDFVPEQNTDFIFCSIGEQFGFLGSLLLIVLYVGLMLRIVQLAERQRSVFSRVYAYSVASILFFHFAINISMTIGLAPVIGITLPFLSYGGSSLVTFSIFIFILIRLDADRGVLIR